MTLPCLLCTRKSIISIQSILNIYSLQVIVEKNPDLFLPSVTCSESAAWSTSREDADDGLPSSPSDTSSEESDDGIEDNQPNINGGLSSLLPRRTRRKRKRESSQSSGNSTHASSTTLDPSAHPWTATKKYRAETENSHSAEDTHQNIAGLISVFHSVCACKEDLPTSLVVDCDCKKQQHSRSDATGPVSKSFSCPSLLQLAACTS